MSHTALGILNSTYGYPAFRGHQAEILANLRLQHGRVFIGGFDRLNIRYRVVPKDEPGKQLLRLLRDEHPGDAGIEARFHKFHG